MFSEVRNLDQKLVGAISTDKRVFEVQQKNCVTQIKVKPDGTLCVTHRKRRKQPPLQKKTMI